MERAITVKHLPAALRGKRLLHISDLHICARISEDYLIKSLKLAQAFAPEFIVYTGDFISLSATTQTMVPRVFNNLARGSIGTVGILGNHDYGQNWAETSWADFIMREADAVNIPILRNELLTIQGLQLIGLDDLWARQFNPAKAFAAWDRAKAALVLCHNPDSLDVGDWQGYQGWVLSGHTHGGQCKSPFLPPPIIPVKNKRYTSGYIPMADGRSLYINPGLGFLHQIRFNVRPEITVFTLS